MKNFSRFIFFAFVFPIAPMMAAEPAQSERIVILGGGVGSLTSALYLARGGVHPLVIEGPQPGGLLSQSHTVQNWPGELEISGSELTEKMRRQAEANGARFLDEEVVAIDFSKQPLIITTRSLDGQEQSHQIQAEACIVAMGTQPNFLDVPGEKDFWGHGVTNCAICDGALYRDKIVGVVGGGDAAVLEALYLSNIAKEVYVFVRKSSLRAIEEKRVETLLAKPNVKIIYNTVVQEIKGEGDALTQVTLKTGSNKPYPFSLDGLFLAIGSTPNSALFQKALKLDKKGYIVLEKDQQTSREGIYAIGDIVDPVYKQAISAAGDGAKAALQAQHYLSDRANNWAISKKAKVDPVVREVIEISSLEQFQKELSTSALPVVIDFYATWCGPCKRISPLIESSADQLAGKVKFLKVNVDTFFDLSSSYKIKAMPTVLLIDPSGSELDRKVGMDQIAEMLKELSK